MGKIHEGILIRPPSERNSFLLQVTHGCSHNKCSFCLTYKFVKFKKRSIRDITEDILLASRLNPSIRRVFLCDGNSMCLSTEELLEILDTLNRCFPKLERVGTYANASDILSKTDNDLVALKEKKLGIAYVGLESGNDEILKRMRKGATCEEMVQAVVRAQACGIEMSVIVLLGLGSTEMSNQHAIDTARAVSKMNPRYLSALTLMLLPGTPLYGEYLRGSFKLMDPISILDELYIMIDNMEAENCIFRTNHASNYLPIGGTLSRDKMKLLEMIETAKEYREILRPESHRAL